MGHPKINNSQNEPRQQPGDEEFDTTTHNKLKAIFEY